jgi:hypothetical protein
MRKIIRKLASNNRIIWTLFIGMTWFSIVEYDSVIFNYAISAICYVLFWHLLLVRIFVIDQDK